MNKFTRILALLFWVALVAACAEEGEQKESGESAAVNTNDKADIVGIWHIKQMLIAGSETSDGKCYFHFKEDGTVDTRPAPMTYQSGTYKLEPQNGKLFMIDQQAQKEYTYTIRNGNELEMHSTIGTKNNLSFDIKAVKVEELPVTPETDAMPMTPGADALPDVNPPAPADVMDLSKEGE